MFIRLVMCTTGADVGQRLESIPDTLSALSHSWLLLLLLLIYSACVLAAGFGFRDKARPPPCDGLRMPLHACCASYAWPCRLPATLMVGLPAGDADVGHRDRGDEPDAAR
jgi:hypothetical protein